MAPAGTVGESTVGAPVGTVTSVAICSPGELPKMPSWFQSTQASRTQAVGPPAVTVNCAVLARREGAGEGDAVLVVAGDGAGADREVRGGLVVGVGAGVLVQAVVGVDAGAEIGGVGDAQEMRGAVVERRGVVVARAGAGADVRRVAVVVARLSAAGRRGDEAEVHRQVGVGVAVLGGRLAAVGEGDRMAAGERSEGRAVVVAVDVVVRIGRRVVAGAGHLAGEGAAAVEAGWDRRPRCSCPAPGC